MQIRPTSFLLTLSLFLFSYPIVCCSSSSQPSLSRHCVSKDVPIHFAITSLLTPLRRPFVEQNLGVHPQIEIWESVNGYLVDQTIAALYEGARMGLRFHFLNFHTYGTLAIWLTKFFSLRSQLCCSYRYLVLLEDDVTIKPEFLDLVRENVRLFEEGRENEIAGMKGRLCSLNASVFSIGNSTVGPCLFRRYLNWGEAYLISYGAAERLMRIMLSLGVTKNIDNEFDRIGVGLIVTPNVTKYLQLQVASNSGDALRTMDIPPYEMKKWREITRTLSFSSPSPLDVSPRGPKGLSKIESQFPCSNECDVSGEAMAFSPLRLEYLQRPRRLTEEEERGRARERRSGRNVWLLFGFPFLASFFGLLLSYSLGCVRL